MKKITKILAVALFASALAAPLCAKAKKGEVQAASPS